MYHIRNYKDLDKELSSYYYKEKGNQSEIIYTPKVDFRIDKFFLKYYKFKFNPENNVLNAQYTWLRKAQIILGTVFIFAVVVLAIMKCSFFPIIFIILFVLIAYKLFHSDQKKLNAFLKKYE